MLRNPLLFALLAAVASAGFAHAQLLEFSVLYGGIRPSHAPLGSLADEDNKDDDTRFAGLGTGYGARFTLNTPGYYGHEVGYIRSRATLRAVVRPSSGSAETREGRVTIQHAFYNFLIYFMPAGERWRPFITGGLQIQQYGAPRFAEWDRGRSRNYGGNYGGGIKLRLLPHAWIRLDVRDYLGGKPYDLNFEEVTRSGGILRNLEGSIGISFAF